MAARAAQVYVGQLPKGAAPEDISRAFSSFGSVVEVSFPKKKDPTNRHAFVEFFNRSAARAVTESARSGVIVKVFGAEVAVAPRNRSGEMAEASPFELMYANKARRAAMKVAAAEKQAHTAAAAAAAPQPQQAPARGAQPGGAPPGRERAIVSYDDDLFG